MVQVIYSMILLVSSILVYTALFLLRRLADNPKGIFGLSGLLTGIGALAKFYLGKA
jgi:hypothetical protein